MVGAATQSEVPKSVCTQPVSPSADVARYGLAEEIPSTQAICDDFPVHYNGLDSPHGKASSPSNSRFLADNMDDETDSEEALGLDLPLHQEDGLLDNSD